MVHILIQDIDKFYKNINANMHNNNEINNLKSIFTNIKDEIVNALLKLAKHEILIQDKENLENFAKNTIGKNFYALINNIF